MTFTETEMMMGIVAFALILIVIWMECQRRRMASVEAETDRLRLEQDCTARRTEYVCGQVDALKHAIPSGSFGSYSEREAV